MTSTTPGALRRTAGLLAAYARRPRLTCDLFRYAALARLRRGGRQRLDAAALKARARGGTLFVLGSGYSVRDVTPAEWRHMERHQTMSFNWFVHQDFVRVDFHLFKEVAPNDEDPAIWRPRLEEYARLLGTNGHYDGAALIAQGGLRGINYNRLVGLGLLPRKFPVFEFRVRDKGVPGPPSTDFSQGLAAGAGTLSCCVDLGALLGFTEIVLVGVDLYDRRYFWLEHDETRDGDRMRGATATDRHNMADGVIGLFGHWADLLARRGVRLAVYNPRSLLAGALPVYARPGAGLAGAEVRP